jgi:hypothetical protein
VAAKQAHIQAVGGQALLIELGIGLDAGLQIVLDDAASHDSSLGLPTLYGLLGHGQQHSVSFFNLKQSSLVATLAKAFAEGLVGFGVGLEAPLHAPGVQCPADRSVKPIVTRQTAPHRSTVQK